MDSTVPLWGSGMVKRTFGDAAAAFESLAAERYGIVGNAYC